TEPGRRTKHRGFQEAYRLKTFIKEYWAWMAVPFVLVVGALVLAYFFLGSDEGASPFIYNVH
ncbi:MAG: hypothetical protein ABL977_13465, partial [Candidatus Eisenbacteria bacterium]